MSLVPTEYVESCVNQQAPSCKAKYSWVTDSGVVAWGKSEKHPSKNKTKHETVSLQAVEKDPDSDRVPVEKWADNS